MHVDTKLNCSGKRITSSNKVTVHCGEMDIFTWSDTDFVMRPQTIHLHPNRTRKCSEIKTVLHRSKYHNMNKELLCLLLTLVQGKAPNDLALIELTHDLEFDSSVNAACLPDSQSTWSTNTPCSVAGWGYTKHDEGKNKIGYQPQVNIQHRLF